MGAPAVKVEMLFDTTTKFFGYFILDTSTLDGTDVLADAQVWTDISAYVLRGSVNRGRQRDIDEFHAGTCSLDLDNSGRVWDPDNTSSIYYGQVQPARQIRISAVVSSTTYQLFQGYVQDWQPADAARDPGVMTVSCADSLSLLAAQQLDTIAANYSGDLSSARVTRVLNLPEVNFPLTSRNIATGLTTFGPTTFGTNAAQYLQACANSEGGALFIDVNGVLQFQARNTTPGAAVAVFSDDGLAASVPYLSVTRSFKIDLLYNRVVLSGTSGVAQVQADATSQAAYQIRTLSKTGLLALNDADMNDLAGFLLAKFSTPELRFKDLAVDVGAMTAAQQQAILAIELTNRVTVKQTPLGSSTQISQAAVLDAFSWRFSPGALTATVTVSAGSREFGFVLDDTDLGVLDTAFLAA